VSFSPQLLDALARVFARAAVDRVLEELAARKPRQELEESASTGDESSISENASKQANNVDPKNSPG
jgi:hypothetical protein